MNGITTGNLTREIEQLLKDLLTSQNISDEEKLLLINEVLGIFRSKCAN